MAIDKVKVTGDIYVPLTGTELVTNGDFTTAGAGGAEIFSGWGNQTTTATREVQDVDHGQFHGGTSGTTHAANLWTDDDQFAFIRQLAFLTIGKKYKATFDIVFKAVTGGSCSFGQGGFTPYEDFTTDGTKTVIFTAIDTGISFAKTNGVGDDHDFTIDNVAVIELTAGPVDTYPANGTHNGQIKYTSKSAHADGVGGTETWDIWWDNGTLWIISPAAGTKGADYWSYANATVEGDYTANGDAAGTATVKEAGGGLRGRQSGGGRHSGTYRPRHN